jgi:dTMP kinase
MGPGGRKGLFIAFEGTEGSGKSTQARLLADRLAARGLDVDLTREPGGTELGERVRDILLHQRNLQDHDPRVQALLMSAARAQHLVERVRPHLERGGIVVCDRFAASTIAYQGGGFRLRQAELEQLTDFATAGVTPDLYLLLDVPVQIGLQRSLRLRGQDWEKAGGINWNGPEFHERVRRAYLDQAESDPERWQVVDGTSPVEAVAGVIGAGVESLVEARDLRRASHAVQAKLPLQAI